MRITRNNIPILILGIFLIIAILFNMFTITHDFITCANTCGNYESAFNSSGCFCSSENITVKPMYDK